MSEAAIELLSHLWPLLDEWISLHGSQLSEHDYWLFFSAMTRMREIAQGSEGPLLISNPKKIQQ